MDYKNMKPGYQGVKDDMRDMAYEMAGVKKTRSKPQDVPSKDCKIKTYAEGGVAKIRHGVATADGTPIGLKKGCNKKVK